MAKSLVNNITFSTSFTQTRRTITMKLQILCSILVLYGINAEEKPNMDKSKRNIYHLGEDYGFQYQPQQYLTRFSHVKSVSEESPQVDITYKSLEETKPYQFADNAKHATNQQYKFEGQVLQQALPTFATAIHQQPITLNPSQNSLPPQHLLAQQYPISVQPRVTVYRSEKLTLPPHLRPTPSLVETFSSVPIIYGQTSAPLQQLKFVQPHPKSQYSLLNPQHQQYVQQQYKAAAKLQAVPIPQQPRKVFHPQFYEPQVFENPIVPQLQHYLPPIQSPFDAFTRPHFNAQLVAPKSMGSHSTTISPPHHHQKHKESEEDSSDERRNVKEELHGEVIRHEHSNEEDFEKGYEESAKGFPGYKQNEEDDYKRPSYDGYRNKYKEEYDDDSSEDDHRGYHSHREYTYPRDEKRGKYSEDYEGNYSQKHLKREPSSNQREEEYEGPSKSKHSSKNYRGSSSYRKPSSDNRHSASSSKSKVSDSDSKTDFKKPIFESGFEPIKSPFTSKKSSSAAEESQGRKSSSHPSSSKKVYKENWYISKSGDT